jgi:hypothetical protein
LEEIVAAPVKKTENTTGGIRCVDHAAPSIRESWHYFAKKRRSLGRHSSLADESHGVFLTSLLPMSGAPSHVLSDYRRHGPHSKHRVCVFSAVACLLFTAETCLPCSFLATAIPPQLMLRADMLHHVIYVVSMNCKLLLLPRKLLMNNGMTEKHFVGTDTTLRKYFIREVQPQASYVGQQLSPR